MEGPNGTEKEKEKADPASQGEWAVQEEVASGALLEAAGKRAADKQAASEMDHCG
jgi:hypothetical protein